MRLLLIALLAFCGCTYVAAWGWNVWTVLASYALTGICVSVALDVGPSGADLGEGLIWLVAWPYWTQKELRTGRW